MPRPARFTSEDVLDAALAAVAGHGLEVTIAMIAKQLNGPVGSIYHRFESRDEILIRLWIRCVQRFQYGYFQAARGICTYESLIACARFIPRYCNDHPDEAVGLTLFRQERLLGSLAPGPLRDQVVGLNDELATLLTSLARDLYGDDPEAIERVNLAVRIVPYGVVRGLVGKAIPPRIEGAVVAAAESILYDKLMPQTTPPGDKNPRSGVVHG